MRFTVPLLALAALAGLALTGCRKEAPSTAAAAGKVRVVATIFPLADVVAQVGGDDVAVTMLLPPGQTPHDYEPKPQQAEEIAAARMMVMVGLGIDEWASRIAQDAGELQKIKILRMADVAVPIKVREQEPGHEENPSSGPAEHREPSAGAAGRQAHAGHHPEQGDPHLWLDPVFMEQFVPEVAKALGDLDPGHREAYAKRAAAYVEQLKALDQEYRTTLARVKRRQFVTFHSAFTYVAARYGLEQAAVYSADAAGFGTEQLEKVADFIKAHNLKVIFAEPQFPAEKLDALAQLTGARVARLDPEGNPMVKGYDSYLAMMRSNLKALAEAMNE